MKNRYGRDAILISFIFSWFFFGKFQVDSSDVRRDSADNEPRLDDLEFWHRLIALITSIIEEDKTSYGPYLNQFPTELSMADVRIIYSSTKSQALNGLYFLRSQLQRSGHCFQLTSSMPFRIMQGPDCASPQRTSTVTSELNGCTRLTLVTFNPSKDKYLNTHCKYWVMIVSQK